MDLRDGFILGDWEVRPKEGRLLRSGEVVRVRAKAMDVLCVLAEAEGQAVDRDTLLNRVWGPNAVSDEPLTSTIGELRRLVGERQGAHRYIETIPKRGYRLLLPAVPTTEVPRAEEPAAPQPAEAIPVPPLPAAPGAATAPATRLPPRVHRDWRRLAALALAVIVVIYAVPRLTLAPEPTPAELTIAVLPFDNLSAEPEQDYFADGLSEELMKLLTRIPELRVAARGSSFAFRGQALDVREVARHLQVAHVITGSVRRLGERVRVSAQLVSASDGYQLWSETYDRTLDDIFAIQDEIAAEVVGQLSLRLLDGSPRARETEPRAYTLHLQARHVARQHTADSLHRAVDLYREALAIDPDYVPAWTELSVVYANLAGIGELSRAEGHQLARDAALRGLAIDPNSAQALDRLGWLALYERNDLAEAAHHYRHALALQPHDSSIRSNAAVLAVGLGQLERAVALLEEGAVRDPVSAVAHSNLANAYYLAGRLDAARQSLQRALTLSPDYAGANYRLVRILLQEGDVEGARAAATAEAFPAGRLLAMALVHHVDGREADADAAIAALVAEHGDRAAGNVAEVAAFRGRIDEAFDYLERELAANGASGFLEYRWNPLLAPLHGDPRWGALLSRAGYADDQLAAVEFHVD
jgi:TolB-like protein/DNA-binding winged helix-turn-helix (wHTH) protein/thioredoxin-like negative regulator of GroEL